MSQHNRSPRRDHKYLFENADMMKGVKLYTEADVLKYDFEGKNIRLTFKKNDVTAMLVLPYLDLRMMVINKDTEYFDEIIRRLNRNEKRSDS